MGIMLGDYVHYNQSNYDAFGINRITESPSEGWDKAAQQLIDQINVADEINKLMTQAKEMENIYNNLYYGTGDSDAQSQKFRQAMQQASQELLEEKFGLMAGNFNPSNIGVDASQQYTRLRSAIKATRDKIKINMVHQTDTTNELIKEIQKINQLMEEDEIKNITFAQQRIAEVKNITKRIENQLTRESKVPISSEDIETLNKIIMEFNRDPLPYNQAGDLFEWVAPYIELRASNLGKEELVKEMKKLSKTSNLGEAQISIDMPDLLSSENLEVDIQQGNIDIKTATARSKTDVTVSYKDNQGREFNNLQVSAKSISGKHIKLVELTSLYRVFVLSQNYTFATHYLNVVSASGGKGKVNPSQILQANRLVKGLALKMGAEGYDINNPAELLVVNNRKEKHIYVYNLKALVYIIVDAMINQGKYTGVIKGLSDDFTIKQKFEDTKENRIGKLVQAINNVKITGTLSGAQLNAYLSLLQNYS